MTEKKENLDFEYLFVLDGWGFASEKELGFLCFLLVYPENEAGLQGLFLLKILESTAKFPDQMLKLGFYSLQLLL